MNAKKVLGLGSFFLLLSPLSARAALTDNLQSYWKFDENIGTSMADSVASGTGTWQGTLGSQWTTGKINSGGNFNGSDNYVNGINNVSLTATDISISFWVKFNSGTDNPRVLEFLDGTGVSIQILWDSTQNKFGTKFTDYQSGNNGTVWNTPSTGVWYHVVGVFSASNNSTVFYVNNVSQSGTVDVGIGAGNVAGSFNFGVRSDLAARFNGTLDEVGIWSRALIASEVSQLYNCGVGLQYPFSDSSSCPPNPTVNRLAKFITSTTLGDSLFSDDGSNITLISGNLFMQISSLIDTLTSGPLNFGTINATAMTFGRPGQNMNINSNVSIGMGTSISTATLHVNGDIFGNFLKLAANSFGLDTSTSGTLTIGATTANAIIVGRTGVMTTIPSLVVGKQNTSSNCTSNASPAMCDSAPSGSVAMTAGGSTLVVNTTAVTTGSQILITEDSSLGVRLDITCNTGTNRNYSINARVAGTSFTIKSSVPPNTNKACLNYWIIN